MTLRLRGCVAFLLLVLGGCADPAVDGPPDTDTTASVTPTSTNPPAGENVTIELFGCVRFGLLFGADGDKVRSQIPAGFSLESDLPVMSVGFDIMDCEYAVIDNQTVIPQVAFTLIAVSVIPPSGTDSSGAGDSYVLELFLNNETLASAFSRLGFANSVGTVEASIATNVFTITVADDEGAVYEASGAGNASQGQPGFAQSVRYHRVDPNHRWIDMEIESSGFVVPAQGLATAHGHALAELAAGSPETIVVAGGIETARFTLTFGGVQQGK